MRGKFKTSSNSSRLRGPSDNNSVWLLVRVSCRALSIIMRPASFDEICEEDVLKGCFFGSK